MLAMWLCLIAIVISIIVGWVMPLMYPLVPGLAATLGLNPVALFSCIYIGGLATALSPFSTGGALTIASCID